MAQKHALDGSEPAGKKPRLEQESPSHSTHGQPRGTQTEQELAVGITAFVSPETPGLSCLVKQRFTDFLVNELSINGEVLHLKSDKYWRGADTQHVTQERNQTRGSEEEKSSAQDSDPSEHKAEESTDLKSESNSTSNQAQATPSEAIPPVDITPAPISAEDKIELEKLLGEQTTSDVLDLWSHVLTNPHLKFAEDHPTVYAGPFANIHAGNVAMRAVHFNTNKKLASRYRHNVEKNTPSSQESPHLRIRAHLPSKSAPLVAPHKRSAHTLASFAELGGDYLHFTLHKEGKDTMEVLAYLASRLKIPVNKFEIAGTKDRRAVTVQRVAVYRVYAHRIAGLNKDARGFVVSDFEYKPHGIGLGDLGGNEFNLTLRNCCVSVRSNSVADITVAVKGAFDSLRRNGFINYYGLQRFGSFNIGTHVIGRKILQGDLKGAVDLILAYDDAVLSGTKGQGRDAKIPQDDINRAHAIKYFKETGQALEAMPRRFMAESAMMRFLGTKDKRTGQFHQAQDWQGALMQIQRNLRLMYVHAYQSLVWNTVATHRVKLYGNVVREGDLVIVGEKDEVGKTVLDDVDEEGRAVLHPVDGNPITSSGDGFIRARALTKEEAESGRYDIFDIVLPLPGFDVVYPKNEIGKFYVDFMASETGGGIDPYNMRRTHKDFSLSGGYRKIMARPLKVEEPRVLKYGNELEQFVETDLQMIKGEHLDWTEGPAGLTYTGNDDGPREMVAVIVKLQLSSSQYATMALRELTNGGAISYVPQFSGHR